VCSVLDQADDVLAIISADIEFVAQRWPQRSVGPELAAYIADRLMEEGDLCAVLSRLRVRDLFLAWWSGLGEPAGIAAVEEEFADDLRAIERRFRRLPVEDARQDLRIKLFTREAGEQPRIHGYSGFGFLRNWLRVTAVRSFLDAARALERRREREPNDEFWAGLADSSPDPRLAHLRDQLSAGAKHAFAAAIDALEPRQRNFLRHAHVDKLTLDQIASLYSVHRATVARALARARQQLVEDTRANLAATLRVGEEELESVIRALDTGLDLSLSRVLATQACTPSDAK